MRKLYIFIVIFFTASLYFNDTFSQVITECDVIEKNNLHNTGNYDYRSKKGILLKPGFSYKASSSNKLHGSIDQFVICELDNDNKINEYNSQNPYVHNKSLPVGSTGGVASVSPTGAATYEVPIFVSPGTAGMQPSLSVIYNSQSGNGMLGMGWHLSGLSSISLSPNLYYNDGYFEAIKFNDQLTSVKDRYQLKYILDGNRLVCVAGNYGQVSSEYRTEMESFSKITYNNDGFIVHSKEGIKTYYGSSNNSKLKLKSGSNTRTFTWYIDKIEDPNDNYILYEYYDDISDEKLIKKISYTGNANAGIAPYNHVEFLYGEREDKSVSYISGTAFSQTVLLERINVYCEKEIVKEYVFRYSIGNQDNARLSDIGEHDGHGQKLNSTIIEWGKKGIMGKIQLETTQFLINQYIYPRIDALNNGYYFKIGEPRATYHTGDFNGDGLLDFCFVYNFYICRDNLLGKPTDHKFYSYLGTYISIMEMKHSVFIVKR